MTKVKGSKKLGTDPLAPASALPVHIVNNVRIYNVTGYSHHKLPDWMVKKNAKQLKKDIGWRQRVQLVQDFDFPEASLRLAYTPGHQYLVATGVYKPQFRVYDLQEMTLKFERHTGSETIGMEILSEDWRKLVLLQADRTIEFHGGSGLYHSTRIPKMGRDCVYDWNTCDFVVGASSSQVYRLNLDRGQFMAPFETNIQGGVNSVRINPLHGLYGFAGDDGIIEFWDRRVRESVASLALGSTTINDGNDSFDATCLYFLPDGLGWVAGTSDGRIAQFDLRSAKPISIRDHHNGFPIKRLSYHQPSDTIIAADKKAIKFWKKHHYSHSNSLFTAIEPDHDVNDVCIDGKSGLVLVAVEDKSICSYFVPELGPAPKWCSFLENITEEMEEKAPNAVAVYDNYKFVTRSELASLALEHLIGTDLLRAYMHGFFIDLRLYEKAKSIANPYAYEEYLVKQRQTKLEAQRASRIRAVNPTKPTKVNKNLATKLYKAIEEAQDVETKYREANTDDDNIDGHDDHHDEANNASRQVTNIVPLASDKKKKIAASTASALLTDARFSGLFNDPDFEIDEESHEYKLLHPVEATK